MMLLDDFRRHLTTLRLPQGRALVAVSGGRAREIVRALTVDALLALDAGASSTHASEGM